jgi:uncharacterized protein with ACT and thioredoxin-like domain
LPEELHPGVYVEEVAYRSKAIPGVPTVALVLAGVLLGVAAAIALEKVRRRHLPPTP